MSREVCSQCNGSSEVSVFVGHGDGGLENIVEFCSYCAGTGLSSVPDDQEVFEWRESADQRKAREYRERVAFDRARAAQALLDRIVEDTIKRFYERERAGL